MGLTMDDNKFSSKSAMDFQVKGGFSDLTAQRYTDYDDQGTPLPRGIMADDEQLINNDESSFEIRRQVTDSITISNSNSPFKLLQQHH